MSTTLRTGPLPRTGSTRSSPSSRTRAMSEPKMAVAPPAGAVMTVTVLAFMALRSGSFHVSSGRGTPGDGPPPWGAACSATIPDTIARMDATRIHRRDMDFEARDGLGGMAAFSLAPDSGKIQFVVAEL